MTNPTRFIEANAFLHALDEEKEELAEVIAGLSLAELHDLRRGAEVLLRATKREVGVRLSETRSQELNDAGLGPYT